MQVNFDNNKKTDLSFDVLKTSVNEENLTNTPFNGLMHFEFIERLLEIAERENLKPEISRIEAVNNKNKYAPGVSQIPNLAQNYGDHDHRSMLFRRVFSDILFYSHDTEEYILSASMIYHQQGVQIGIGPEVKSCTNLCIMGTDHYVSTYGKNSVENIDHMFSILSEYLKNSDYHFTTGKDFMDSLKSIEINKDRFKQLIGSLFMRKSLNDLSAKNGAQFLKEKQINELIDTFNEKTFNPATKNYEDTMDLYSLYSQATEFHRPVDTDIPNIIEGNAELNEIFNDEVIELTH